MVMNKDALLYLKSCSFLRAKLQKCLRKKMMIVIEAND